MQGFIQVIHQEYLAPKVHAIPNDYWLTPVFVSVDIDLSCWTVSIALLETAHKYIHPALILLTLVQRTVRLNLSGGIESTPFRWRVY